MSEKEKEPSQLISFSGGQVSHIQLGGIAGRDMNMSQNQQIGISESSKPLAQADVVELIAEIEALFRSSDLPETQTAKAIKHLESAKDEAQQEEPDKDFAAKSLQRATKVLKEADETVEAGTSLWQKVDPIITKLLPWLGVAASFFTGMV
ncbi:hypothetical protein [Dolichospermum sp. UHCC 0259]|uniref:hypothetical protein n=1 Tax=Dolichospermum sp. UHCC 0259 TaxID=2590010 RepID=UPI00144607E2|nr:hypothetical protein [Dolichospermum sp. UHCC 0259]MTJ50088.1 hypothetical protein [Dolichospermum sp. UHCC 0259]